MPQEETREERITRLLREATQSTENIMGVVQESRRSERIGELLGGLDIPTVEPTKTVEEAQREVTGELGFGGKFLVGAGQRLSQTAESLTDLLGIDLGLHTEPLPGLGAGGFLGQLTADLPLFVGLGAGGRALQASRALKGLPKAAQTIARESAVGAGFGAITHPEDRLGGAATEGAIFGGLTGGLLGGAALGRGVGRLLQRSRLTPKVEEGLMDMAERGLIKLRGPEGVMQVRGTGIAQEQFPLDRLGVISRAGGGAEPIVTATTDRAGNILGFSVEGAERMRGPWPAAFTDDARSALERDFIQSTNTQKAKLADLRKELKDTFGWADDDVRDIYEAWTGVRSATQMTERGASRVEQELRNLATTGNIAPKANRADPLFVQMLEATKTTEGTSVPSVRKFFEPAAHLMNTIQERTGIGSGEAFQRVIQGKAQSDLLTNAVIRDFNLATGAGKAGLDLSSTSRKRISAWLERNRLTRQKAEGVEFVPGSTDDELWKIVTQDGFELTAQESRVAEAITGVYEKFRGPLQEKLGVEFKPVSEFGQTHLRVLDDTLPSNASRSAGNAWMEKVRSDELLRYQTDPIEAVHAYIRRASKALTLDDAVLGAEDIVRQLRALRGAPTAGEVGGQQSLVAAQHADEVMEYALDRIWGMPTKGDQKAFESGKRFFNNIGMKGATENDVRAGVSILRDSYYASLLGLRIPFPAARNLTQPFLLTNPLMGPRNMARGFRRATSELARGETKGVFKGQFGGQKAGIFERMEAMGSLTPPAEAMEALAKQAEKFWPKASETTADLRDKLMVLFSASDRWNRLWSWSTALEAFEATERNIPQKFLSNPSGLVDWFMKNSMMDKALSQVEKKTMRKLLSKHPLGSKGQIESWAKAKEQYAAFITNKTQFAYSSGGAPLVTRSVPGKLTFQFLSWPMYYGAFMNDLVKEQGAAGIARYLTGMYAAMEYLAAIDYNPTMSVGLGPFQSLGERSEFGQFIPQPGPVPSSMFNIAFSMLNDASNALGTPLALAQGDKLEEPQFLKTLAKELGSAVPGGPLLRSDIPRLQRIIEGQQKNKGFFVGRGR
jgi:hypothetical protein